MTQAHLLSLWQLKVYFHVSQVDFVTYKPWGRQICFKLRHPRSNWMKREGSKIRVFRQWIVFTKAGGGVHTMVRDCWYGKTRFWDVQPIPEVLIGPLWTLGLLTLEQHFPYHYFLEERQIIFRIHLHCQVQFLGSLGTSWTITICLNIMSSICGICIQFPRILSERR
jgi:hypothetical protein